MQRSFAIALYGATYAWLFTVPTSYLIAFCLALPMAYVVGRLWGSPVYLCCLAGWATAHFSGGAGGASGMHQWLMATFGLAFDPAWELMVWLRKGLHFIGYGVLALLAQRAVQRIGLPMAAPVGLAWALIHAALDEARQSFTLGRQGSLWDVLLNVSGAIVVLALYELVRMSRRPAQTS